MTTRLLVMSPTIKSNKANSRLWNAVEPVVVRDSIGGLARFPVSQCKVESPVLPTVVTGEGASARVQSISSVVTIVVGWHPM
jgi:hypothetical protein